MIAAALAAALLAFAHPAAAGVPDPAVATTADRDRAQKSPERTAAPDDELLRNLDVLEQLELLEHLELFEP